MLKQTPAKYLLSALACAALMACGGGSENPPVDGQVFVSLTPATDALVVAGERLAITADATATLASVTSQAWTVTQLSGTKTSAVPAVTDVACASAVVVTGQGTAPGLRDGTSVCSTYVTVPEATPSSEWVVHHVAKSATSTPQATNLYSKWRG